MRRHSLGSAIAMLAAAKVQADPVFNRSVDGVYSVGGPRVGASNWEESYNALGLGTKTLRFVYYKDPITLIPPQTMGYHHVGRTVILPLGKILGCFYK